MRVEKIHRFLYQNMAFDKVRMSGSSNITEFGLYSDKLNHSFNIHLSLYSNLPLPNLLNKKKARGIQ